MMTDHYGALNKVLDVNTNEQHCQKQDLIHYVFPYHHPTRIIERLQELWL